MSQGVSHNASTATSPLDVRRLGRRLASARGRCLLTQERLSHMSGVSIMTISQLERGKNPMPSLGTILRLANNLEVTLDELVYD